MASRGVNKVIVVGNLGQDPEIKYLPNGGAVASISVATSESWKDKQTGEQKELTEWHRVVMYRRLAEVVGEYLRKGSKVYIEGKLKTTKWSDNNGVERWTTEIVANEMQMLDARGQGQGATFPASQQQNGRQQGGIAPNHAPQNQQQSVQQPTQNGGFQRPQQQPVNQQGYQNQQQSGIQQPVQQAGGFQRPQQPNQQQSGVQQPVQQNQSQQQSGHHNGQPIEPLDFDDDIPF